MIKRVIAILACLMLLLASGCEFFAVPSATSTPAATSGVTTEPSVAPTTAAATETVAPTDAPTATPTEAPTVAPTATSDSTEGMIFPDSDTRLLKWSELIVLKPDKLALARNEIYARMGYTFTTKTYADYFGALSWYHPDSSFTESEFSDIQLANIHLIQAAETVLAGKLFELKTGAVLDFDQDGMLETLTFSVLDDSHMNVLIKDGSTTTTWKITGYQPVNKVFIGDINYNDGILDLFVGQIGDDDYATVHVAGVKHHAFLDRGTIPGTINSGNKKDPFKADGKGVLTTLQRIDTVGTDFFIVKYKLNSSGKLVFSKQSSYNFDLISTDHYMVTTKVAIPLMKTTNALGTVLLTIPAGTSVELVSTDTVKWVKVKAPGGTGWLELASPLHLANPAIPTTDAFDGLIMAD